jgi:hypothetical protein
MLQSLSRLTVGFCFRVRLFLKSFLRLPHEVHHHRFVSIVCLSAPFLKLPTGEAGSGKSCLLHHFTHNSCTRFIPYPVNGLPYICQVKAHSQHTIGVEFSSRTVKLGEKRIKLQVCQSPPLSRYFLFTHFRAAVGHCRAREIPVRERNAAA